MAPEQGHEENGNALQRERTQLRRAITRKCNEMDGLAEGIDEEKRASIKMLMQILENKATLWMKKSGKNIKKNWME